MVQINTLKYKIIAWIAIAANCLFFGWLGAQANDRDLPVIIYTVEASPPVVTPGSVLQIEYTLVRHRSCDVSSDRFIIDAQKKRIELPDLNIKSGLPLGQDHYIVPVPVSLEASKGKAVYRTITEYRCNPLQYLYPIKAGVRDVNFIIN